MWYMHARLHQPQAGWLSMVGWLCLVRFAAFPGSTKKAKKTLRLEEYPHSATPQLPEVDGMTGFNSFWGVLKRRDEVTLLYRRPAKNQLPGIAPAARLFPFNASSLMCDDGNDSIYRRMMIRVSVVRGFYLFQQAERSFG